MKQRGFAVEYLIYAVVLAGIAAAFFGLWSYYSVQLTALKKDNQDKQKAITELAKEKAEGLARETALETANKNFVVQVKACNDGLADVIRERNMKTQEAKDAQHAADYAALQAKGVIASILSQKVDIGKNWCDKWSEMVMDYSLKRRANVTAKGKLSP